MNEELIKLLDFIKKGKWYLDGDGKWYTTKNRGDYSQKAPRLTNEELVKKIKKI